MARGSLIRVSTFEKWTNAAEDAVEWLPWRDSRQSHLWWSNGLYATAAVYACRAEEFATETIEDVTTDKATEEVFDKVCGIANSAIASSQWRFKAVFSWAPTSLPPPLGERLCFGCGYSIFRLPVFTFALHF